MLRPTIARRVLRFRTARISRTISSQQPPLPTSFATGPDPSTFPLYRPAPPPPPQPELTPKEKQKEERRAIEEKRKEEKRAVKVEISEEIAAGVDEYSEEALREFYTAVVLSGGDGVQKSLPQIAAPERTSPKQRQRLLGELSQRLESPPEEVEEGAAGADAATGGQGVNLTALTASLPPNTPTHVALTAALIQLAPEGPRGPTHIPLGIVRHSEWRALFDDFVAKGDGAGAEVLFSTMERHGVLPSASQIDEVVELYAKRGDTAEVARLIEDFDTAGLEITDHHRDMLIASHLYRSIPDSEGAIALLTSNEELGRPFPQSSYNVVLSHLTEPTRVSQPNSRSRALAWDLFAHMRFAAHPQPTRELYSTMIRACGDSRDPQPERARDLWAEMTAEGEGIEPTRVEYDAMIRALGSTKKDYLEAYELLRQMLAKHQEATIIPFEDEAPPLAGTSPWVPSLETFTALLEGTKRAGDLERARWVLSEVVELARGSAFAKDSRVTGPHEEMMASVFMTYAAWTPRVTRSGIKETNEKAETESKDPEAKDEASADKGSDVVEGRGGWTPTPPQTRAEALHEATVLFEQIVLDIRAAQAGKAHIVANPFAFVRPTARLVNSYLSVQYAHAATLEDARKAYESTWALMSSEPSTSAPPPVQNGWTYLAVLERCARGRQPRDDRPVAQSWGWETWEAWRNWFNVASAATKAKGGIETPAVQRQRWLLGLGERQVERAWAHAIRLAALGEDLPKAIDLLAEFMRLYPASDITDSYTPYLGPGLKLRMMEPSAVAEPNVPPHLLFSDLDVLHQRCVRDENWAGVALVKKAATAYERSVAKRRKWRIRGAGVKRELKKRKEAERIARGEPAGGERIESPEHDEEESE